MLRYAVAVALLTAACDTPEGGETYEAWFRPLSGFCPRFVVGEEYAWVRGKVAPGTERRRIREMVYTFRGEFLKDANGEPKMSKKCQGRPYPIFKLFEVVASRPLADGERPPGAADAAERSGLLVKTPATRSADVSAKPPVEKAPVKTEPVPSVPTVQQLPALAKPVKPIPAAAPVPSLSPSRGQKKIRKRVRRRRSGKRNRRQSRRRRSQ